MPNTLPKDGTRVVAMTYESPEYDRPAREITGTLRTAHVESLDYVQCWVDDVQVDPGTVRPTTGT